MLPVCQIRKFHKNSPKSSKIEKISKFLEIPSIFLVIPRYPSEKLEDKILRKYVRQFINVIFVEFDEQLSIHLILINIDTRQYFTNQ
jgi:hypothetical protein